MRGLLIRDARFSATRRRPAYSTRRARVFRRLRQAATSALSPETTPNSSPRCAAYAYGCWKTSSGSSRSSRTSSNVSPSFASETTTLTKSPLACQSSVTSTPSAVRWSSSRLSWVIAVVMAAPFRDGVLSSNASHPRTRRSFPGCGEPVYRRVADRCLQGSETRTAAPTAASRRHRIACDPRHLKPPGGRIDAGSLCPRRRGPHAGAEARADEGDHRRGGAELRRPAGGRGRHDHREPEGQQGEGRRAVHRALSQLWLAGRIRSSASRPCSPR